MMDPEYRSILGKIGWLNTISRPDLAYTYSMLSLHSGGENRIMCLANALKYIGKTTGYKMIYRRGGCENLHQNITSTSEFRCNALHDESLITYNSSPHGGEHPMAGYTILLGGTPIEWQAYRQTIAPLSSCQGKYVSANAAAMATLGIRNEGNHKILRDIQLYTNGCIL